MSDPQSSPIEYDKSVAVFGSTNEPDGDQISLSEETENQIHESGRLQLNTYQAFVQNIMNPQSDSRSLMLVHMTGTGKTITALATATEYVRQYEPTVDTLASIVVLGFTKDIFKKELLSHPEFLFVNMDEAKELKDLELHMHDSPAIAEQYQIKRRRFNRRLIKREVKGIYQFYGYKQFVNRIINMEDVHTMIQKYNKDMTMDAIDFDTRIIKSWIDTGNVRINTNFIKSLSRSLVICDEVHNLYRFDMLNTYGLAIQLVFDYFYKTLPTNDMFHGSVRSLLLSATPLTTSALSILPIITLLTGDDMKLKNIFKMVNGVDQLTALGSDKIRKAISGKISYVMDDNPKEYPSSSFVGEKIKNIEYIKFIRTYPTGHQLACFKSWKTRDQKDILSDERGNNMIKDIAFPSTKEYPDGVVFSKNITDLADLPEPLTVRKSADGWSSSNIYKLKQLPNYSSKYAKLVQMCIDMKDSKDGKMFIYHPSVQGSGTDLIVSILRANGFVLDGDNTVNSSLCMYCSVNQGGHDKVKGHEFNPVRFTYITGSLSKSVVSQRLNAFNNLKNLNGENIKIIIGSRAMRESHTLVACRHVVIAHEPSSISEMVQIIGRAVRKHVHSGLPESLRTVQIYILTTCIESLSFLSTDLTTNEEYAYRMKVLQYGQINRIERIMYDVSIDYLINFRFKLQETPKLLGEMYPLDSNLYTQYEKVLNETYSDLRNGVTPHGIHTNRFNVFYMEGEVRLVIMIIKRIILDYQPVVTIAQLQQLVREPPFHIEYNTKLISNESIAVAINNVVFRQEQLQIMVPSNALSTADTLFDRSPILLDNNGIEYKVVCIGDPLCLDSYLVKRKKSAIIEGDKSVIDSFKEVQSVRLDTPIDMRKLCAKWASTIDLNDVINDLYKEFEKKNMKGVSNVLMRLPIKTHGVLAEWIIEYAVHTVFKSKKVDSKKMELVKYLINFYETKRVLFAVYELNYTRIYDRYKKYDKDTGMSWFSKSAKPSTAKLPICHSIGTSIRVFQPSDSTWLDLNSIGYGVEAKHPYGYYIYEERIPRTLNVAIKIKYDKDINSKGMTMLFLQMPDIIKIANQLKVNIKSLKYKNEMIDKIEAAAWAIQAKIYPKRLIYRLIDLKN